MLAIFYSLLEVLTVMVPMLLSVAFMTVVERKVLASMQRRVGPNAVGAYGMLQPFADALKLVVKEVVLPSQASTGIFLLAPVITLTFSLLGWAVVPFGSGLVLVDSNLGLLYTLAVSSIGVYGILLAGWSANSKYAFLGSLRSSAQMVSYELILSSAVLPVVMLTGTFSLTVIVESQQAVWCLVPLLPVSILYGISVLAETNRTPFDLPEAESELVSGFMTEHAGVPFVAFFLGEYCSLVLMSALTATFFLGGYGTSLMLANDSWLSIEAVVLSLKSCLGAFGFVWFRATLARMRWDSLMSFCWTGALPLSIAFVLLVPSILIAFDAAISPPTYPIILFFPLGVIASFPTTREGIIKEARTKDTGGPTTNLYIIAKRWIDSGTVPTAKMINTVLNTTGTARAVTDADVVAFKEAYDSRLMVPGTLAKAHLELMKLTGLSSRDARLEGSYIISRNTPEGKAVNVGGSKVIANRLRTHCKSSNTRVGQDIKVHGATSFTVEVVLMPSHLQGVPGMTNALEQWTMFYVLGVLKPAKIINFLLIANSSHFVPDAAQLLKMRQVQGKKVYIYSIAGVLLYVFPSQLALVAYTCYSYKNLLNCLSTYGGKVGTLLITMTPVANATEALIPEASFIPYFDATVKKASSIAHDALLAGHSPLHTVPGAGPIVGLQHDLFCVVDTQDRTKTYKGSATEVATWIKGVYGQASKPGVVSACKDKRLLFGRFEITRDGNTASNEVG